MGRHGASSNSPTLGACVLRLLLGIIVAVAVLLAARVLANGSDGSVATSPALTQAPQPAPVDVTGDAEALRGRRWEAAIRYDSYLAAMVGESGFGLVRWHERTGDPLRIYLPAATLRSYTANHRRAALEAFSRWSRVGPSVIPVVFSMVRDSTDADVIVDWVPFLADGKAGQATITRDGHGWISRGRLALALGSDDGGTYGPDATYTIALHEIGHLLGLGHSDDPADVMYPSTRLQDLSSRDRTTARLLYQLLPGPVPSP